MFKAKCLLLFFYLLSSIALADQIEIAIDRDANGARRIESKVVSHIPETDYTVTNLDFPGVATKASSRTICNQLLIPMDAQSVVSPQPLTEGCKIWVLNMNAFQCPGGHTAATVVVEGPHCESTLELVKTSEVRFTATVETDGPDVPGVSFVLK